MANSVTTKKHSASVKTALVTNASTVGILVTGSANTIVIDTVNCETYDRATIQIRNASDSGTPVFKVFGTLYNSEDIGETPLTTGMAADSRWVQIGDDISVGASSGAMKSISTTGLRFLCVITKDSGSNAQTFPVGDCKVFLQGTI